MWQTEMGQSNEAESSGCSDWPRVSQLIAAAEWADALGGSADPTAPGSSDWRRITRNG